MPPKQQLWRSVATPKQQNDDLIETGFLKKIIECCLISPYIKDEKPISLIIVAKAESGKTTAMKLYRDNKGICYMTDCTAYGLTRDVLPKLVSGEVKTMMIADLITPLSRSTKTRKGFVAFLNNFIEEGIAKITTYATIWEKEIKGNVITAITDDELKDGRREWAKMGFLSRFIIFSYSYSMSTITKILQYYSEKGTKLSNRKINLPKKELDIELSKNIADQLDPVATKIGESFNLYGIRAKINFRCLLKTLAVRNNKKIVTDEEFREFLQLADYMNFDMNVMR
jgi:hypothetical protein